MPWYYDVAAFSAALSEQRAAALAARSSADAAAAALHGAAAAGSVAPGMPQLNLTLVAQQLVLHEPGASNQGASRAGARRLRELLQQEQEHEASLSVQLPADELSGLGIDDFVATAEQHHPSSMSAEHAGACRLRQLLQEHEASAPAQHAADDLAGLSIDDFVAAAA